jgi:hypothetical protein
MLVCTLNALWGRQKAGRDENRTLKQGIVSSVVLLQYGALCLVAAVAEAAFRPAGSDQRRCMWPVRCHLNRHLSRPFHRCFYTQLRTKHLTIMSGSISTCSTLPGHEDALFHKYRRLNNNRQNTNLVLSPHL